MKAKVTAEITSNNGGMDMLKKGLSIPSSGFTTFADNEEVIKCGNRVFATKYAKVPATSVDPYDSPTVAIRSLPAPCVRSAIPVVTKARIMRGIMNLRKELKIDAIVMIILLNSTGAKDPRIMPTIMPIISLGTSPNFF
jgi:hypothetical protein